MWKHLAAAASVLICWVCSSCYSFLWPHFSNGSSCCLAVTPWVEWALSRTTSNQKHPKSSRNCWNTQEVIIHDHLYTHCSSADKWLWSPSLAIDNSEGKGFLGERPLCILTKSMRKRKRDTFLETFNNSTSSQSVLHDTSVQQLFWELAG